MMGWNEKYRYKVLADIQERDGQTHIIFNLSDFEMSVLMPERNHEDQEWKKAIHSSAYNTKFLHDRRVAKSMTQKDVSDEAKINLRHYQMFECGTREIANASFRLAMSVCDALGIEPKELL